MQYNFDTVIDRSITDCEKYSNNESVFGTSDVIPLWIADMDFASGEFILEAIKNRANHGVLGYVCRCDDFWKSIQWWLKGRTKWEVEQDWLQFSPGVVGGLVFSILANTNEGDGVMIQPPVYHPFANVINNNNRKVINNPLVQHDDGTYSIDFEDMERKASQAKVFVLCNPQNPTGRVFTEAELVRMGEICLKHNLIVISDEIHMDFVYAPYKHIHFATLDSRFADITITLSAPSKSFNIAGLCTAYAIIPNAELREQYAKEMAKIHCDNSNIFGVEALKAAYTDQGAAWLEQMLEYLESNIDYVLEFLATKMPEIKCAKPQATFLLWLDFRAWGLSLADLKQFLIKEAKLGLNSGCMYGIQGEGFQRINVGAPRVVIEKAMEQLYAAAVRCGYVK